MKLKVNKFFIIVIFLLIIVTPSILYAKGSIVDYYNLIPIKFLDDYRFQLRLKNNIWISHSDANYELKPVVDIKNGYLKISDSGTGGGVLEHELALYRTSEGSDIIGVNITQFDGVSRICKIRFYKPADNQWIDTTDEVLPKVDLSFFMNENYKLNLKKFGKLTEGIVFIYQLPRIGTTLGVKIELDRFIISNRQNDNRINPAAKEILKNIKYQEIKLPWDKRTNIFNTGEKISFTPSEEIKKYLK